MVKVSIRDYMPPYTTWMQVELEEGVCYASPATIHNEGDNAVEPAKENTGFTHDYETQGWENINEQN